MNECVVEYDLIVIGGGPAGMSAAISARKSGVDKILLIERDEALGGTINQCIHCNFGKRIFEYEITGSEYAEYFIKTINELDIDIKLNTMVLKIDKDKKVSYVNPNEGMKCIKAKAIVLAMGSREKYNGNANIPLNKFTGIYTVGTAHRFINIQGYLPGKEIVILAANDHDFIVIRRLIVEGAQVKAVVESPHKTINKSQLSEKIIKDFNVPIKKGYILHEVLGEERVSGVVIKDAENHETEEINCDSLLISVEWVSESDLAKNIGVKINKEHRGIVVNNNFETDESGIFACGNVVYCNNYADTCVLDGEQVGLQVFEYLNKERLA